MSDIPPPEQPGWYADAQGAWWWWDGGTWTAAPGSGPAVGSPTTTSPREQERTQTLLMWILFIVLGGWIAALVFYLIAKDEKRFLRHHAAEALNLTIVMVVPQVVAVALLVPGYVGYISDSIDEPGATFDPGGAFYVGLLLLVVIGVVNLALSVTAAVRASRGAWWRLPIGLHPVRGVLRKGEAPPYDVGG